MLLASAARVRQAVRRGLVSNCAVGKSAAIVLAALLAASACRDATTAIPSHDSPPHTAALDAAPGSSGASVALSYTVHILAPKGDQPLSRRQVLDIVHRLTDLAATEATTNKQELRAGHRAWHATTTDASGALAAHRVLATGRDPYTTIEDVVAGTIVRQTDYTWKHQNGVYRLDGYTMLVGPKGHELLRITARFDRPFGEAAAGRTITALLADLRAAASRTLGHPLLLDACDAGLDPSCVDGCDPYLADCTVSSDSYDATAYNDDLNATVTDAEAAADDGDIEVADDQALAGVVPDSCSDRADNLRYATYATVIAIGALRQALWQANIPAILLALAAYGSAQAWQITQRGLLQVCIAAWNKSHPTSSP